MKRLVLIIISVVISLSGCNTRCELQKIASQRLDTLAQKIKEIGGECSNKSIIENDSLCLYSSFIKYSDQKEINVENIYIRTNKNNMYVYYESSRVSPVEKLLSEEAIEMIPIKESSIDALMRDKGMKEMLCKLLYDLAYNDCLKKGKEIKAINK